MKELEAEVLRERISDLEAALLMMHSAFDPDKRWLSDADAADARREAIEAARESIAEIEQSI